MEELCHSRIRCLKFAHKIKREKSTREKNPTRKNSRMLYSGAKTKGQKKGKSKTTTAYNSELKESTKNPVSRLKTHKDWKMTSIKIRFLNVS